MKKNILFLALCGALSISDIKASTTDEYRWEKALLTSAIAHSSYFELGGLCLQGAALAYTLVAINKRLALKDEKEDLQALTDLIKKREIQEKKIWKGLAISTFIWLTRAALSSWYGQQWTITHAGPIEGSTPTVTTV